MIDFYGTELKTFKANLHAHSTASDGIFTPAELIRRYADAGYDVLALTDHRHTHRIAELDPCGMTLLSGIELHPPGPRGIPWHLIGIGVRENFIGDFANRRTSVQNTMLPDEFIHAQAAVDASNADGGAAFCAHPHWCGLTSGEVASVRHFAGIEVYNHETRYIGKSDSSQLWNEMLDAGRLLPAIAVDDTHRPSGLFGGWTIIAAPSREPSALIAALRRGHFYATQGPELRHIDFHDGIFQAEFSECAAANLLTNTCNGFGFGANDPAGGNASLRSLRVDVGNLPPGSWLRLQLQDASGRSCWAPPIQV